MLFGCTIIYVFRVSPYPILFSSFQKHSRHVPCLSISEFRKDVNKYYRVSS